MFAVLLQSIVLASGGILSVGSITIVILLLLSDKGWRVGLAYVLGYVGGYLLIGVAVVSLGYSVAESDSGESGGFVPVLFVVLGLLLLWMTQRNWRNPVPETAEPPRIFTIIDKFNAPRAFAFGAAVTVINFKNLAIFLSAVSVVLLSDLALASRLVLVFLVVLVFCGAVIAPILIYVAFPHQADRRLNGIKQTLETHRRPIGIWVPLIFGVIFLIRGISGLI